MVVLVSVLFLGFVFWVLLRKPGGWTGSSNSGSDESCNDDSGSCDDGGGGEWSGAFVPQTCDVRGCGSFWVPCAPPVRRHRGTSHMLSSLCVSWAEV